MMRMLIAFLALMFAVPAPAQQAEPMLVADVSKRQVDIQYSFSGEQLLLYGAILYPGGMVPDERVDIVVVLRGPAKPIILREKRRVAGVWINAESVRFGSAPGYYAVGSSRPISELVDERTASIYELGLSNLQLSPAEFDGPAALQRFEKGLISLNQKQETFVENPKAVEITGGVLYSARLDIPARVPVGRYVAETFLISKGKILAAASRNVDIRKSGFERFVARAAERHGFFYGLAAVLISLAFGYAASAYFNRR
jgi:uncharacterized protein (TIGR02186 family)